MIGSFNNIVIQGIASAVPTATESNYDAMPLLGERRCKKQIKLTGIEERHVSPSDQTISDLCYVAAKKLLDHLGWEPEEIDVLVLVTQMPDFKAPSTAFWLHKLLGLKKDCVAFDVNLGCSAFNVGMQIVSSLLQQVPGNAKALCLQGDLAFASLSRLTEESTVASNMLFGSAGSATAIEKVSESCSPIPYLTKSDGSRYEAIINRNYGNVSMDGQGVFNFAINDVAEDIVGFMQTNQLTDQDIDFYVFHQAQKLILDSMDSICGIPEEKDLRSLMHYGNTSGASISVSLCTNIDRFRDMQVIRTLTCGFGVGLSWSMTYFNIAANNILPIIETDQHFS